MNQPRILITGGAGFIGSCLARKCVERGWPIFVLDDLSAGCGENLAEVRGSVTLIVGDVANEAAVDVAIREAAPTAIAHLAAMHFIPDCNARPVETWRTNVLGTACVVETATRHSVPRLIFASSGAIYQSQPDPLVESAPLSSSDVYARTKEAAERVCGFYASRFPLGCIIARLFNTYGPREKVPHLIPHVLKSAQAGTEIPLGNLSSKRDYIYVEDTAEALLQMLAQPKFAPVANIGSGRQYSAAEVVAQVAKLTGRDLRIRTEAGRLRAVDKPFQVANVDVMLKTYGWAPKFSLEEGLAELIRTMDGRLTADGRSS